MNEREIIIFSPEHHTEDQETLNTVPALRPVGLKMSMRIVFEPEHLRACAIKLFTALVSSSEKIRCHL